MVSTNEVIDMGKGMIPKVKVFGAGTISIVAWIFIAVIFIALMSIGIYLLIRYMRFNKKIIIFEEINGRFEPTRKDRAMEMVLSKGGDTIFYLARNKKYLPTPNLQTGRKTFWFFVRSDNEWINFTLENLNEKSKEANARFLDKEMRYARTQIQRGLKERYDKPSFWERYGLLIFSIAYIVIIGVMMWLLFDKWIDLAGVTNLSIERSAEVMEVSKSVMEKADAILGRLDNIGRGGSGYVET